MVLEPPESVWYCIKMGSRFGISKAARCLIFNISAMVVNSYSSDYRKSVLAHLLKHTNISFFRIIVN